jgi:hypothetical protein
MLYPSAIIFSNDDLTSQVQEALKTQLFLDEIMSGTVFDGYVAMDGYYPDTIKSQGKRILVMRNFVNMQNQNFADVVLFIKAGLASVQKNNFGPPMQTFPVANLTMFQLLGSSSVKNIPF